MPSAPTLSGVAVLALVAAAVVSPAVAQEQAYPPISARQFTAGSIEVRVTGSQTIDETIPINVPASIGDGEVTWLQYGASGSESPNSLITCQMVSADMLIVVLQEAVTPFVRKNNTSTHDVLLPRVFLIIRGRKLWRPKSQS